MSIWLSWRYRSDVTCLAQAKLPINLLVTRWHFITNGMRCLSFSFKPSGARL